MQTGQAMNLSESKGVYSAYLLCIDEQTTLIWIAVTRNYPQPFCKSSNRLTINDYCNLAINCSQVTVL